jgi:hypothetical protein
MSQRQREVDSDGCIAPTQGGITPLGKEWTYNGFETGAHVGRAGG